MLSLNNKRELEKALSRILYVFAVWLHTSPGSSQHLSILICQSRSTQSALEDHLGGHHSFIMGEGLSVVRVLALCHV